MHPAAVPLNSLAPQSASTQAGNPQAPPANALTDPIPAHEVASLADGLHRAVQEDPSLHEAAAAIHLLARGEPRPDSVDEACCQRAAHLLLRLKHAGLLCQLAQAKAARALMRQHGSVQRFEFDVPPDPVGDGGPHPLDADIITALLDLATRNRLRDPLRFAWGAGKGFARSAHGGHVPGEVGELISGMLDPTSLLALALTSKAAYSGAMRPWNDRVDALAALLAPAISFRKLVQELGKLPWLRDGLGVDPLAKHPSVGQASA